MSQKYDTENLLHDVKAILVANLNTAIAAVEAEKIAMGLPATGILPVSTSAGYFEQSWSDDILNITPAIFFGVESIGTEGIGEATIRTYKLFVEVVLVDSGMDKLGKNRIHRYARAIEDVMQNNSNKLPSASTIKIETVRPISFKLDLNSSEEIKIGGVSIMTALA
jgi:hypothetical protein